MKLILGIGEPLVGRLLLYDALAMRFRELKLRKNPECPVCGDSSDHHQADRLSAVLRHSAARAALRRRDVAEGEIDPVEVKAKMDRGDTFVLIDVREPHEYQICSIPDVEADPAGRSAQARERAELGGRDRGALQERHAQRQGRRLPEAGRLQEGEEHEGRHSGLER